MRVLDDLFLILAILQHDCLITISAESCSLIEPNVALITRINLLVKALVRISCWSVPAHTILDAWGTEGISERLPILTAPSVAPDNASHAVFS